jgi:predicted DNA-binding WGR domain protein
MPRYFVGTNVGDNPERSGQPHAFPANMGMVAFPNRGGLDADMARVFLERINRGENAFRFYTIGIETDDLFGEATLVVEWGRIYESNNRRIERSGAEVELEDHLVRLAAEKVISGYRVKTFEGPVAVRRRIERAASAAVSGLSRRACFETLVELVKITGERHDLDSDTAHHLEMLLEALSESPARSRSREENDHPSLSGLQSPASESRLRLLDETAQRLVSYILEIILSYNPGVRDAARSALPEMPDELPTNVIHFIRGSADNILTQSVFDFLGRRHALASAASKLADRNIHSVRDLVSVSGASLTRDYGLSDDDTYLIETVCREYGLCLGMRDVRIPGRKPA